MEPSMLPVGGGLDPVGSPPTGEVRKSFTPQCRQWLACISATVTMVIVGTVYGWTTVSLLHLTSGTGDVPLKLTHDESSWMISLTLLSSMIGSLMAVQFADFGGRKSSLILCNILFYLGWLLIYIAVSVPMLYFARVVLGIAVGIAYTVNPMYVSEVAEIEIRGALIALIIVDVFFGSLLTCVLGFWLSYKSLLVALLVITFTSFLSSTYFPETPHFLVARGRINKACKSIEYYRGIVDPQKMERALRKLGAQNRYELQAQTTRELHRPSTSEINRPSTSGEHRPPRSEIQPEAIRKIHPEAISKINPEPTSEIHLEAISEIHRPSTSEINRPSTSGGHRPPSSEVQPEAIRKIHLEPISEIQPEATFEIHLEDTRKIHPEAISKINPEPTSEIDPKATSEAHRPSSSEIDRPSASEIDRPSASEIDRPSTSEIQPEDTIEVHRPSTSEIQLEDTIEIHRPSTSKIQPEDTMEIHRPSTSKIQPEDTIEIHRPSTSKIQPEDTIEIHRPSTSEIDRPSTSEIHRPSTSEIHRPSTSEIQPEARSEKHPRTPTNVCMETNVDSGGPIDADDIFTDLTNYTWRNKLRAILQRSNRKALFIMLGLIMAQQLSGNFITMQYLEVLFSETKIAVPSNIATTWVLGIGLASASISTIIVDFLGRRTLLILSTLGSCLTLVILGTYLLLVHHQIDVSMVSALPIIDLIVYQVMFQIGLGVLPNVLQCELFPSELKGFVGAIIVIFDGIIGAIVSKLYQVITDNVGSFSVYFIFATSCILAFLMVFIWVPETKGKTYDEIEALLDGDSLNSLNEEIRNYEMNISRI